jgi:predicted ATPase
MKTAFSNQFREAFACHDFPLPRGRTRIYVRQGYEARLFSGRSRRSKATEEAQSFSQTSYRSTGSTVFMPWYLSNLAMAYADVGQFDDALSCIDQAMMTVERTKERWCDAEVHRVAGEIVLRSPKPDAAKAEHSFDRAFVVARQQQAKSWELRAAMSMARLWRDQGKRQQAHDLLARVYGWFTEGFDTLDLKEAKTLLDEPA